MAQQQVKAGDTVKVHYRGWLEDGTVFDSSEERDPFGGREDSRYNDGNRGQRRERGTGR